MKETLLIILITGIFAFSCKTEKKEKKEHSLLAYKTQATLGEGALWDYKNDRLLWVDIEKGLLNLYDPASDQNESIELGQKVGTVVPVDTGGVLLALKKGIYRMNLQNKTKELMVHPEAKVSGNRYNDGKCDPSGRFWVGTMGLKAEEGVGALYRIDHDFSYHRMIENVSISNGIVWSLDASKMYYIDTPTRQVVEYEYNDSTGSISNPEVIIEIADSLGHPDGSTLDANGNIWIAMWGGNAVTCWDPHTGKLLKRIKLPAPNVTSCAFGGKDMNQLYVTTARSGLSKEQLQEYPLSGSLFVIDTKVEGVQAEYFKSQD